MLRIKELRQENNISQKFLAEHFKMSQGNLCDWEKGRTQPDVNMLIALADYFGVSVDYLVGRDDNAYAYSRGGSLTEEQEALIARIESADAGTVRALAAVLDAMHKQ